MTVRDIIWEKKVKIYELKQQLRTTNDDAIAYAVGELTEAEYAPIREQRKTWRAQINALEAEIKKLKG